LTLRDLATAARERGDETAALRAEIATAAALVLRGRAAEGARMAATAAAGAATRGLAALAVEARLQQALGELDEPRAGAARALADAARLHLACGDRANALQASTRAVTEAVPGGLDRAVARALLVRAALSRDEGDLPAAREHAAAALTIARAAGLGPERYAA